MQLPVGDRARLWAYLLILALAGAFVIFPGLGDSALMTDEGMYIQIVNHIRETGDWTRLVLYGQPYFNKPPLYFWITALTADWLPEGEAGIRFWSALFGLASVLLTARLAACWHRPETGLLAGALLLGNGAFLLKHGAREGCFDTGITLLALATYLTYTSQLWRRIWGWIVMGLAAAAICLFKPIYGLPLLGLLGLHFVVAETGVPWRRRLLLPSLALLVCVTVASPWYLFQVCEFGTRYLDHVFGHEIAQRATAGLFHAHLQGPFFYPLAMAESSTLFLLSWPALAWCGYLAWQQPRSWAGWLLWMTVGWVSLCSLSSSKLLRYVYVIFPLISVAIAVFVETLLAAGWQAVSSWRTGGAPRWDWTAAASFGMGLAFLGLAVQVGLVIQGTPRDYPPWRAYCRLQPEIEREEVRFIAYRYLGGAHGEAYYGSQMKRLLSLDDELELERLLACGPTVLLVNDPALVRRPGFTTRTMDLNQDHCIPLRRPCFLVWAWPVGLNPDLSRLIGPCLAWVDGR